MQRLKDEKRLAISRAAVRLFANRPFHEVLLDDVAAAAGVGKGTLYVYFKNKEDLYFSLIHDGFSAVVDRLKNELDAEGLPAIDALRVVITELVAFSEQHPALFELMRSFGKAKCSPAMDAKRSELSTIIEQIIRRGIRRGELRDPHPELTAQCVPGLVRSVFLFGPKGLEPRVIVNQLVGLLGHGLRKNKKTKP
ncbi:MAG: TetR/AcrR family transcriptional regulator [Planctomycetes bacterium]|nr:TetR/AcrR family transcriptional regulator [Planctomycetota bacterium]